MPPALPATSRRPIAKCGSIGALNSRYLDALALLVREQGRLVSKDRFLDEVWRGIPVTDEALTQCIKTLRRQLGDDAALPRFIETVPKHGYRFIAPVEAVGGERTAQSVEAARLSQDWRRFFLLLVMAQHISPRTNRDPWFRDAVRTVQAIRSFASNCVSKMRSPAEIEN